MIVLILIVYGFDGFPDTPLTISPSYRALQIWKKQSEHTMCCGRHGGTVPSRKEADNNQVNF